MYWVKCPHCKKQIEQGYTWRSTKLGTPVSRCPECSGILIDNEAVEWSVVSPFHRIMFCSFANNRHFFHFFSLIGAGFIEYGILPMIVALLITETIVTVPCYYLVKKYYDDDIRKSYERAAMPGYIEFLQDAEYKKLDKKYRK